MSKENVRKVDSSRKGDNSASFSHEIMKPRWTRLEYVWQIDNFWEIRALASIEALDSNGGDIVWSQRFGDEERGIWRLKCYPFGDSSSAGQQNVSLFLNLDTETYPGLAAYAIFGCSILDDNGDKIPGSGRSFTRQKFNTGSDSWGWSQFIKVEGHSLSRMLAFNQQSLVVRCEVDVFVGLERLPGFECPVPRSLKEDVCAYASSYENSDVVIRYGSDGQSKYDACSFLLKSRCGYFRKILNDVHEPVVPKESSTYLSTKRTESDNGDTFDSLEEELPAPTPNNTDKWNADRPLYPDSPTQRNRTDPGSSTPRKRKKLARKVGDDVDVKPISATDSLFEKSDIITVTQKKNAYGKIELTVNHLFDEKVVLAFLTSCHVGMNAMTSPEQLKFPTSQSTLTQVIQLVQLAHVLEFRSLYWECIDNLGSRMITKEDAVVITYAARQVGCTPLEEHAKKIATGCHRHPEKTELLKLILPKTLLSPFRSMLTTSTRRSASTRRSGMITEKSSEKSSESNDDSE